MKTIDRTLAASGFPRASIISDDPAALVVDGEGTTRRAVIGHLLDHPATATEIAARLGLSTAGVRRHLDALVAEGAVSSRECRSNGPRGRGRPAREYLLTDTGRARLPHAYDHLAAQALEYVGRAGGEAALVDFARQRAEGIVADYRDELDTAPDRAAKIDILRRALTSAGFSASVDTVGAGYQLCQHHCPVAHVAEQFPQLCQAELDVFADAVGGYVQRLATIAHGDSFCTTFVPDPPQGRRLDIVAAGGTPDKPGP